MREYLEPIWVQVGFNFDLDAEALFALLIVSGLGMWMDH